MGNVYSSIINYFHGFYSGHNHNNMHILNGMKIIYSFIFIKIEQIFKMYH